MNQDEGFVSIGVPFFEARVERPRHHQYENILFIYCDSEHAAGVFRHDSGPYTCSTGICISAVDAMRPTQVTAYHATRVRTPWNLGNECADHAAALGSLGLITSHNVATHWVRGNFDTSACCDGCNSISEILERLHSIRTEGTSLPQDESLCCVLDRVLCDSHARICVTGNSGFDLSLLPRIQFASQEKQWKAQLRLSLPRGVLVKVFAYNTLNPLLELLFHVHTSSILSLCVDEFDLAKIAFSCHFVVALLCYKEGAHDSA